MDLAAPANMPIEATSADMVEAQLFARIMESNGNWDTITIDTANRLIAHAKRCNGCPSHNCTNARRFLHRNGR